MAAPAGLGLWVTVRTDTGRWGLWLASYAAKLIQLEARHPLGLLSELHPAYY